MPRSSWPQSPRRCFAVHSVQVIFEVQRLPQVDMKMSLRAALSSVQPGSRSGQMEPKDWCCGVCCRSGARQWLVRIGFHRNWRSITEESASGRTAKAADRPSADHRMPGGTEVSQRSRSLKITIFLIPGTSGTWPRTTASRVGTYAGNAFTSLARHCSISCLPALSPYTYAHTPSCHLL